MTFKVGDEVIIGVNGYDWDTRGDWHFEDARGTVEVIYDDVEPPVYDVYLHDRNLHKELGGYDDQKCWPFYEKELIRAP